MGVNGLLPLLKPIALQRHATHFSGLTLGVDGYGWLHKAASACAEDLALGRPAPRLIEAIDRRVRLYEHAGVRLYFVFDGASPPLKQRIEAQRRASRDAAREKLRVSSASREMSLKALEITPEHAACVVAYCRARGIPYVVAPYEADAQLVFLEQLGAVDAILSEDSDLLVFGARRLLTKADSMGNCLEIQREHFLKSQLRQLVDARGNGEDLDNALRALAILSGCDYSPGVRGLGLAKASPLVRGAGASLRTILQSLETSGRVDTAFVLQALRADLAFQYQRVWNPNTKEINSLTPNPPKEATDDVIGAELEPSYALRVARAAICPISYVPLRVPQYAASFARSQGPYSPAKSLNGHKLVERRASLLGATIAAKETSPFFQRRPLRDLSNNIASSGKLVVAKESGTIVDKPPNSQKRVNSPRAAANTSTIVDKENLDPTENTKHEPEPKRLRIELSQFAYQPHSQGG